MITLNKYADKANRLYLELYGLSTDEKPIEKFENTFISNGSRFIVMDTSQIFFYSEENKNWYDFV